MTATRVLACGVLAAITTAAPSAAPEVTLATVLERADAHGIPAGTWTASVAQARARREQGFRWATVGSDYGFMASAADAAARDVRAP